MKTPQSLFVLAVFLCAMAVHPAAAKMSPFDMPQRFDQHMALRNQLIEAIKAQDYKAMESVSRRATALLPDDPTWHYNLACALSRQKKFAGASTMLGKAISLGFSNTEMLETDEDLAELRARPGFRRYIEKAAQAKPSVEPGAVTKDLNAYVTEKNTSWDFDIGVFRAYFELPARQPETTNTYNGASAKSVAGWIKEGGAAGNFGDFYDNRDNNHSVPDTIRFPGLTRIRYSEDAMERGLHMAGSRFFYTATTNGNHARPAAVIGNASVAMTEGPLWRSVTRSLTTETRQAALLSMAYTANHLYLYPSHHDYLPEKHGDVFSANTPYLITTTGSSWQDKPFMNAFFAALAAFQPGVKDHILRHGLMAPTLQMLLRSTQKNLKTPDDYFTGKAHPVVFNPAHINPGAMVGLAHAMATNTIPPVAFVRLLGMDPPPARKGVDFFDQRGDEFIIMTPGAYAMVMRGPAEKRAVAFQAGAPGTTGPLTYKWAVLQGDPDFIDIKLLDEAGSAATITLTHPPLPRFPVDPSAPAPVSTDPDKPAPPRLLTSRVDIGLFISNGHHWSAPAILSFFYLPNEIRKYSVEGRLERIDYAAAADTYTDPVLSLAKRWTDVYNYAPDGTLLGWDRTRGNTTESFTADGLKVLTRDARDRPLSACYVEYLPRSTAGTGTSLPELIQSDTPRTVTYTYASPDDLRGTFKETP